MVNSGGSDSKWTPTPWEVSTSARRSETPATEECTNTYSESLLVSLAAPYPERMKLRDFVHCIAGAILVTGLPAMALQRPTFSLSNPGSMAGYTDSAMVSVSITFPGSAYEWCIADGAAKCASASSPYWRTTKPQRVELSSGDGAYNVVLRYQTQDGSISPQTLVPITLDTTTPTIALYSPTGLPNAITNGAVQEVVYNNGVGIEQSITGTATAEFSTEPITISCQTPCAAASFNNSSTTSGVTWTAGFVVASGETSLAVIATSAAGKSSTAASTSLDVVSMPLSSYILPTADTYNCLQGTFTAVPPPNTLCPAVSIPNDSPSSPLSSYTFTGYADPSMRRDPSGNNLWMLYSYPMVKDTSGTDVVEIHLASSPTGTGGGTGTGATWSAYNNGCTPTGCDSTAVWPSVTTSAGTYSSHEVANFWASGGEWYAVHLMYFVQPNSGLQGIAEGIPYGCLVGTVASTPAQLGSGWLTQTPSSCTDTTDLPTGNIFIAYDTLTEAAKTSTYGNLLPACTLGGPLTSNPCDWGEPAIMVSGGVVYLAVACTTTPIPPLGMAFTDYGYFIFTSDPTMANWTYYGGPFDFDTLQYAQANPVVQFAYTWGIPTQSVPTSSLFLTEFDWAAREDSSLVAIVTPAARLGKAQAEVQFGCIAVNFSLAQGGPYYPYSTFTTTPFGPIVAAVTDQPPMVTSGYSENLGPNACTYEPTSNTGMLIVRRILDGQDYSNLSLITTGVMP
jgi:hypothetical protein